MFRNIAIYSQGDRLVLRKKKYFCCKGGGFILNLNATSEADPIEWQLYMLSA